MPDIIVPFRLLDMICCRFRLLWIEAELPAFCPRCGYAWCQREARPPEAITQALAATITYED